MKIPIFSSTDTELELEGSCSNTNDRGDGRGNPVSAELISLGTASPAKATTRAVQHTLDFIFSLALVLLLLPLFILIAIAVKSNSRGSVLFVQTRVGKDGRHFPFYKFRSMVQNAEDLRPHLEAKNERNGPVFKIRKDPRITGVGRVLRKFSLDELPQLINVLRGDMSLIGPRPALPREVESYTPRQMQRLAVRPGLTGLWQVSGRSKISFEHSVELDLHYIQNQSPWLNFRILMLTIPAVITGDGAY